MKRGQIVPAPAPVVIEKPFQHTAKTETSFVVYDVDFISGRGSVTVKPRDGRPHYKKLVTRDADGHWRGEGGFLLRSLELAIAAAKIDPESLEVEPPIYF